MKRARNKTPERQPHPDSRIELQLQRIIGHQRAITRYEDLVAEYREQLNAASDEQDSHSHRLRNSNEGDSARSAFELGMQAQLARMEFAEAGIAKAEQAIADEHETIIKLSAELSDTDLSFL
jgi:hypothetical protein